MAEAFHGIGMLLGFGGAMVSCAVMLRLKDDDARRRRGRLARRIAPVTWTGLALLVASGILLTARGSQGYALWLALKHLFVAVVFVDALVIHFRLFPRFLRQIGTPDGEGTYRTMRAVGTLSVVS
jgi:uncharacterized membrane protein